MKLEEIRTLMEKGKFEGAAKFPAPKVIERAKKERQLSEEVLGKEAKKEHPGELSEEVLGKKTKNEELTFLRETSMSFKSGNSDKVYIIRLSKMTDGSYAVKAKWGRRGGSLRSAIKFNGLTKEYAETVCVKLQAEKIKKGYAVITNRNLEE